MWLDSFKEAWDVTVRTVNRRETPAVSPRESGSLHTGGHVQVSGNFIDSVPHSIDLTVVSPWEWHFREACHISLEGALARLRNRCTDDITGIVARSTFDYYINVVKAIRPVGCSSVKAVIMGVTALWKYCDDRWRSRVDHRARGATPTFQVYELIDHFFMFTRCYFSDHADCKEHPHWLEHSVAIHKDGTITFDTNTAADPLAFLTEVRIGPICLGMYDYANNSLGALRKKFAPDVVVMVLDSKKQALPAWTEEKMRSERRDTDSFPSSAAKYVITSWRII